MSGLILPDGQVQRPTIDFNMPPLDEDTEGLARGGYVPLALMIQTLREVAKITHNLPDTRSNNLEPAEG